MSVLHPVFKRKVLVWREGRTDERAVSSSSSSSKGSNGCSMVFIIYYVLIDTFLASGSGSSGSGAL